MLNLHDNFDYDSLPDDFGWEIDEFLDDEILEHILPNKKFKFENLDRDYFPSQDFDSSNVDTDDLNFFGRDDLTDDDFSDLPLFDEEDSF